MAEEGTFVWSDEEPLGYSNWQSGQPDAFSEFENAAMVQANNGFQWGDSHVRTALPYICARKSTPTAATGGEMLGCAGGRWVLGAPYKQPTSTMRRLPPTIVRA
jgi:hypothetical protein